MHFIGGVTGNGYRAINAAVGFAAMALGIAGMGGRFGRNPCLFSGVENYVLLLFDFAVMPVTVMAVTKKDSFHEIL